MSGANRIIEGTYTNSDYGYSVKIPVGVRGDNLAPPAPQHGFGISLGGKNGADSIDVDGSYDALLLKSAEAAARAAADGFAKEHRLVVTHNVATSLSGLDARDVGLESAGGTGSVDCLHFVLAYRESPGEVGIIYTIELQEVSRNASNEAVFSQIVKSFQIRKLP